MSRRTGMAGLAMLALSACSGSSISDAEMPDISLAGLSFARPGLFEQELTVNLRLRNPNEFDIAVDTLSFALDVNGSRFADGLTRQDFTLPGLGETVIPVTVAVPTNDLIERVVAIGTGRRLDYILSGQAEIGSWFSTPLQFSRQGKLALPDLPGWTDGEQPSG